MLRLAINNSYPSTAGIKLTSEGLVSRNEYLSTLTYYKHLALPHSTVEQAVKAALTQFGE